MANEHGLRNQSRSRRGPCRRWRSSAMRWSRAASAPSLLRRAQGGWPTSRTAPGDGSSIRPDHPRPAARRSRRSQHRCFVEARNRRVPAGCATRVPTPTVTGAGVPRRPGRHVSRPATGSASTTAGSTPPMSTATPAGTVRKSPPVTRSRRGASVFKTRPSVTPHSSQPPIRPPLKARPHARRHAHAHCRQPPRVSANAALNSRPGTRSP